MIIAVTVIHVVVCFVLIAVILLQAGRGQGLTTSFGGGEGTQSIFGTRSADFLSKATSVCAILFLITCVGLGILNARQGRSLFETQPKLKTEDLEALQKALAKIQEEEKNEPAAAANAVTDSADGVVDTVSEEADQALDASQAATADASTIPTEASAAVEAVSDTEEKN